MLPNGAISAHRIWKGFRADLTSGRIKDELHRLASTLRNTRQKNWRWVLRDVDLTIAPGESLGLVGANGSGKSTLLKILTKVMYPNAGRLDVQGRIGALIEVRAGLHPDLTGRENISICGTLLGLTRRDVMSRFDTIVEFAELNDAIDRQIKFYSSGMQMRLGFSIAAFLEPDILLVDEVLAVGDASFQQRCLERMQAVLDQGTTLVFVSHDLAAVEAICQEAVWLDHGVAHSRGPVREVLQAYRRSVEELASFSYLEGGRVHLVGAKAGGRDGSHPRTGETLDITLEVKSEGVNPTIVTLGVSQGTATPIFVVRSTVALNDGNASVLCSLAHLPLARGRYYLWAAMADAEKRYDYLTWHPVASFEVFGPAAPKSGGGIMLLAPVYVSSTWEMERAD